MMQPHAEHGVALDFCPACEELWFDGGELDQAAMHVEAPMAERAFPRSGPSAWACPRCAYPLHKAGWTGIVADRCGRCHGMLLDVREVRSVLSGAIPIETDAFAATFRDYMVDAGWAALYAKGAVLIVLRLLRL